VSATIWVGSLTQPANDFGSETRFVAATTRDGAIAAIAALIDRADLDTFLNSPGLTLDAALIDAARNGDPLAICSLWIDRPTEDSDGSLDFGTEPHLSILISPVEVDGVTKDTSSTDADNTCGDYPAPCNCWDDNHQYPGSGPRPGNPT
jgi:hypothetical protein